APRWSSSHDRGALRGGDPGGGPGHAAAAADHDRAQIPRGRQRRAVHRPSTPPAPRQRRHAPRALPRLPGADDPGAGGRVPCRRSIAYDKRHRTPRMRHVYYGLGVLSRGAFESVPDETPHDLETLYQSLLTRGKLAAWEAPHRFYEIGSFEGLEETRRYLASDAVPRSRPDDSPMTSPPHHPTKAHPAPTALRTHTRYHV